MSIQAHRANHQLLAKMKTTLCHCVRARGLPSKSPLINQLQVAKYSDFSISQDKGESPKDLVYDCVLQGLNLVAKQAALPLLDHLFTWRREALVRATRAGGEMIVLRKRVRLSRAIGGCKAIVRDWHGMPQ